VLLRGLAQDGGWPGYARGDRQASPQEWKRSRAAIYEVCFGYVRPSPGMEWEDVLWQCQRIDNFPVKLVRFLRRHVMRAFSRPTAGLKGFGFGAGFMARLWDICAHEQKQLPSSVATTGHRERRERMDS